MKSEINELSLEDLHILRQAPQTDFGRVLFSLIKALYDRADQNVKRDPRVSDVVREDFRYRMGIVEGLNQVLEIPEYINKLFNESEG